MVQSPCTKVCRIGAQGLCLGCKRTLEEIANWRSMSDAERQACLDRVATRVVVAEQSAG